MRAFLLALALFAAPVLAGCVSPGALSPNAVVPDLTGILGQSESLWPDHQNEPHPAWGWPTLTHPGNASSLPAYWQPIAPAQLPASINGMTHFAQTEKDVKSGSGIALFGSLAVVPGFGKENYVVDISDPSAPKTLGTWEGSGRGATIMAMPDGRLISIVSTGKGFDVVNITDPTTPHIVAQGEPKTGGHKVGIVPGTPIIYNANSNGGPGGQTEIFDLSDPENPVLVQEFKNGYGCHHIFFWNDATQEKYRAICAGIQVTQIWDIADPKDPQIITSIDMPVQGTPTDVTTLLIFSHTAFFNDKGTILVVGDELNGGGAAECDGVRTPVKDVSGPFGNLWFYDIKDEKNPKLLGWISPPPYHATDPRVPGVPSDPTNPFAVVFGGVAGCTAHHGRLVPDPEGKRDIVAMAWYGAGVVLIDFTDGANPRIIDEWNPGTNTWEVWYYNGYLFTGDLARGLDVLTFK